MDTLHDIRCPNRLEDSKQADHVMGRDYDAVSDLRLLRTAAGTTASCCGRLLRRGIGWAVSGALGVVWRAAPACVGLTGAAWALYRMGAYDALCHRPWTEIASSGWLGVGCSAAAVGRYIIARRRRRAPTFAMRLLDHSAVVFAAASAGLWALPRALAGMAPYVLHGSRAITPRALTQEGALFGGAAVAIVVVLVAPVVSALWPSSRPSSDYLCWLDDCRAAAHRPAAAAAATTRAPVQDKDNDGDGEEKEENEAPAMVTVDASVHQRPLSPYPAAPVAWGDYQAQTSAYARYYQSTASSSHMAADTQEATAVAPPSSY